MPQDSAPVTGETRPMRYFIDGVEVSVAVAVRAEARGAATVAQGGSGVVPEHLRAPNEAPTDYLTPWMLLLTTPDLADPTDLPAPEAPHPTYFVAETRKRDGSKVVKVRTWDPLPSAHVAFNSADEYNAEEAELARSEMRAVATTYSVVEAVTTYTHVKRPEAPMTTPCGRDHPVTATCLLDEDGVCGMGFAPGEAKHRPRADGIEQCEYCDADWPCAGSVAEKV